MDKNAGEKDTDKNRFRQVVQLPIGDVEHVSVVAGGRGTGGQGGRGTPPYKERHEGEEGSAQEKFVVSVGRAEGKEDPGPAHHPKKMQDALRGDVGRGDDGWT